MISKRNIILFTIILIFILIVYLVLNYWINQDRVEGFKTVTDLLVRNKTDKFMNSDSLWSNRLVNFQSENSIKPLSFWEPNTENGKYKILGHAISINKDYKIPDIESLIVSGRIDEPTNFKSIISIGTDVIPSNQIKRNYIDAYNFVDKNIRDRIILAQLVEPLSYVVNFPRTMELMIGNMRSKINDYIFKAIMLGDSGSRFDMYYTSEDKTFNYRRAKFEVLDKNKKLNLYKSYGLNAIAALGNAGLQIADTMPPDDEGTTDIWLPFGLRLSFYEETKYRGRGATVEIPFELSDVRANSSITKINETHNDKTQKPSITDMPPAYRDLQQNTKFPGDYSIKSEPIKIPLTTFIDVNKTPELVKLKSSIEKIKTIISSRITYQEESLTDMLKNIYDNITNLVNTTEIIFYQFSALVHTYKEDYYEYARSLKVSMLPDTIDLIKDKISRMNIGLDISKTNTKGGSEVLSHITKLAPIVSILDMINNNKLPQLPLRIYEPVAPKGYKAMGHIITRVNADTGDDDDTELKDIVDRKLVACVPEHCVIEVRDWKTTDMVFEFDRDGVYYAVYQNPYIGTFLAVNKKEFPARKVENVVACVEKCGAVDALIKADKCARKFKEINENVTVDTPLINTELANAEAVYYQNKIINYTKRIEELKARARELDTTTQRNNLINREYNRANLQKYVDVQRRNMNTVLTNLEKGRNRVDVNINMPREVRIEVIKKLIDAIELAPNVPETTKTELVGKVIDFAKAIEQREVSTPEFQEQLNTIMESCPEYDLTGLVKKSVVSDVCYGCG